MKDKILLIFFWSVLVLNACTPGKFCIEGEVEGFPDGEVLVLQWMNDQWDTLSSGKL